MQGTDVEFLVNFARLLMLPLPGMPLINLSGNTLHPMAYHNTISFEKPYPVLQARQVGSSLALSDHRSPFDSFQWY